MKNISRLIVALGLTLGTAACGTQWTGNYNGSWSGSVAATQFTYPAMAMTLYQSGSNVNGYWLATGAAGNTAPASGQLQGTVSGSTLTATFNIPAYETSVPSTSSAAGTLTGTLTLSSSNLTGTLTGSVTQGTVTSTVNLTQTR